MTIASVSIITPCYNHGNYLDECIKSVLSQTMPVLEHIIVDDGSTEIATLERLNRLEKEGLAVLRQENRGPSAARNAGIGVARGDYIVSLDADDVLCPTFVAELLSRMSGDDELMMTYCDTEMFGLKRGVKKLPPWDVATCFVSNPCTATALYRKVAWEAVGGYNESMRHGFEDWDFWLSFMEKGYRVAKVEKPLFRYRIKRRSRQADLDKDVGRLAESHSLLIRNHPNLLSSLDRFMLEHYDYMIKRSLNGRIRRLVGARL